MVRTAFAQCVPAATTKYARISIFVVCGVSIRVLYNTRTTMAARPDYSGYCAGKSRPVLYEQSW